MTLSNKNNSVKSPYPFAVAKQIVITFCSANCLGKETAKETFGLRVKLPPAHQSSTLSGVAERQARKLWILISSLWFDPTGNPTPICRFSAKRYIHSTTNRYQKQNQGSYFLHWCPILEKNLAWLVLGITDDNVDGVLKNISNWSITITALLSSQTSVLYGCPKTKNISLSIMTRLLNWCWKNFCLSLSNKQDGVKSPYLFVVSKQIVITFYSPSCLGQEIAKGLFGLKRVKLPPVYHTRRRLHTVPLTAKRQTTKQWIPNLIVFGLTQPGIEPEYTDSVADVQSTRSLIAKAISLGNRNNNYLLHSPNLVQVAQSNAKGSKDNYWKNNVAHLVLTEGPPKGHCSLFGSFWFLFMDEFGWDIGWSVISMCGTPLMRHISFTISLRFNSKFCNTNESWFVKTAT